MITFQEWLLGQQSEQKVEKPGNTMANLRIRINNRSELDDKLPKLKRSLSAQKGIELKDEGNGVFLLVVKEAISLKTLKNVRELLDSYNFSFFYPEQSVEDEDYNEEDAAAEYAAGCDCQECREARERQAKALRLKERADAEKRRKKEEELRRKKAEEAVLSLQQKAQHDATLDKLLKEAMEALQKNKRNIM
jgi:hypothetical protein